MKLISWAMIVSLSVGLQVRAQSEDELDLEMEAAKDPAIEKSTVVEPMPPTETPPPIEIPETRAQKDNRSLVDIELERQNQILKRKSLDEEQISVDRSLNRFPRKEPLFKLPPGPKEGGSVRLAHPRAAEGLLKINRDGSYQYKTKIGSKSQSSTLKVMSLSPPVVTSADTNVTYQSMYGGSNLIAVNFDYEWQPFQSFGSLGVQFGLGLTTATANGTFKETHAKRPTESEESYNIFIVPISTFLIYRFEFVRRQWVVPFINGGITYYGMAEVRDDGKTPKVAGAPAMGGGGGLLFSISRLDAAGAFTLSQEYGVADMWLVLEARAMQGLYKDIDFTNQSFSAGIAVDF